MASASCSSEPAHGAVKGGDALEVGELSDGAESCDYAPTSRTASPLPSSIGDPDDLGDPNELEHGHMFEGTGAMIASGKKISDVIHTFERGSDVVASIFFDALEKGGVNEESLSVKLAKAMAAAPKPKVRRQRAANATCWFVEFCCSKDSALKRIANEQGISYIGLSKDLDDLSDPNDMNQVMMWAHERKDLGGSIHLRGSLPCTAWCSWQHLNRRVLDAGFQDDLVNRRQESKLLVSNFSSLTDVALESGGSSTFEWPRWCSGWNEVEELQDMITKHSMISAYPCGCAFDLTIHGKKPLKPWRLVTTNERVAVEMNNKVCKHPKGHKHDRLEGGKLSYLSGFYNRPMAVSILCSLFPEKFLKNVPAMPTVIAGNDEHMNKKWERIAEQLNSGSCLQHAMGLVHRVLTRKEIQDDPEAIKAIEEEASEVRAMGVWDDSTACEVDELKQWARKEQQEIHIAEVMAIGSIKNDELGPSLSQRKGRLVFRGDDTRNQDGLPAKFRELHSQPASIQTISIVMFYGMLTNCCVFIADAKKAYLQALLRTPIPTWVILPRMCWLPEWSTRFRRVAVRPRRALYGHPEAGDDWFIHLSQIMTKDLGFVAVESFPSLWWNEQTRVLVAAYVDDIVCSGGVSEVQNFWERLKNKVEVGGVTIPGRFLGRDHRTTEDQHGKWLFLSMPNYGQQSVDLYTHASGCAVLRKVSTPFLNESELNANDWEVSGALGDKSASVVMKMLWLARLSRPDVSHAVTRLASGITRWSINHDKMLYRLACYLNSTIEYGVHCFVKGNPPTISLHLYTDADLGGDICTMKSHTGIYLCIECPDGTSFPISWTSRRQQCVSKSTTESELVALNDGLFNDAIPVQTVLNMVFGREIPVTIHEDNQACVRILRAGYSARLKSLNRTHKLSIAALHETIMDLGFQLRYTESADQLADVFTKVLAKVKFLEALARLHIGLP